MNYSSKLIEEAVQALATLPGIGKKTALRLALHLVKMDPEWTERLGTALLNMRRNIQFCQDCHHLSDGPLCQICADARRDHSLICVVEGIRDVMAIEETGQYRGLYHVLGGVISPLDGIGPEALHLDSLFQRVALGRGQRDHHGDQPNDRRRNHYFLPLPSIAGLSVKISVIARGVSFGGELEYADELTLGRSIAARAPYKAEGA
jgi:recombination protein RecR